MKSKVKTIFGLYKKYGRDAFLEATKFYTERAHDTVESALSELESRWFDSKKMMTRADKMLDDYNKGKCILNQIKLDSRELSVSNEQVISM